ncbi:hypothetical protein L210DRAFT_38818 [Boletus edulis BED1]|uniref:Pentatricopeptide repeat-containing protein n=1 Tax=Boletus edulis BED1 TaxID=1328754 RepID=A0AAD4GIN2_BOLED|nr:hypothetical protein L210DRAFT_38818 [Boletus edulis BED1]
MLRGVGRHAKQALLVPGKRLLSLHSSCTHKQHVPHVLHVPPVASPETRPSLPSTSCAPLPCSPPGSRGQFPSGIIDIVDALSSATKPEITSLVADINASYTLRRYFRQRESARRLALYLASTSRPSRAHSVMVLAHALGCRFKPNHFESVLHQLSLKDHWTLIPPLVSLARVQCGKTTARLLNWKTRAFIECHQFGRLDHMIGEFARHNVQPTRRTFHLLVSGHLRNQDLDSAKRCLQLMQNAGFPVDASTHALIVTAYRSLGSDPQVHARALEALLHVDVPTSTRVLNSIIQHLLDIGDECSAAEHINRMIASSSSKSGTARQPEGTTTGVDGAMSSHLDSSSPSSTRAPVIHPDAATFTILINYLNSQRHFHRVHKVLNRMVEIGVKPDAGVVAALIRTYCLSGHDDMAMGLLAAMLDSDADARGVLALLHVKGIPQFPINVKGIDLTVHVLNAVLPRVMEIRGLGGASLILRIMRSNGIQSNAATVQVFLNYLDRIEHIETSRLVQILRSMSRTVHGLTIRHLNVILRNALRREKHTVYGTGWDATAARFSPTRRNVHGFSGNPPVLNSDNFDPSGSRPHPHHNSCIRSSVLALSRKGVKNDRATFAMWLMHEGITDPTLGTAKSVFRHMVDKGMHPNRYHFTSLMDGFTRVGDMQAAEQVMHSSKAAGFEPNVVMWTVLVSGYARKGEPGLAMRAFRMMVAAGIPPDVPAIDALAHAYFAVGAYSVARKILLELWPRVKPFPSELKNAPLKQLARAFRQSGVPGATGSQSLTLQEQRSFNRKLRQVLREWKALSSSPV